MKKLGELSVDYLVRRKYPLASESLIDALKKPIGHPRPIVAPSHEKMLRDADGYRNELLKKTPEEIFALEGEETRKEVAEVKAKVEREERERFFHKPHATADFEHWSKCAHWTLDEAVALSFGKAPEIVSWANVKAITQISKFAFEYGRRRDLALRAAAWKQLYDPVLPTIFLAWARRMQFDVPEELPRRVEQLGLVIADWKDLYDKQVELSTTLNSTIDNLQQALDSSSRAIEKQNASIEEIQLQLSRERTVIEQLRSERWEGFDDSATDYPEELDLALQAWRAVHNSRESRKNPKDQIKSWLEKTYPNVAAEAKERIAVVCNWDKRGGRPKAS